MPSGSKDTEPVPTIKDCIENWFQLPFPDYNMGLLPDEEGFDSDKLAANYKTAADKEVAQDVLERICARERLDELRTLKSKHDGPRVLNMSYADMLANLNSQITELQTQLEGEAREPRS